MATRGRKPKPTKLHVIAGTYRADRHSARAGEPESTDTPKRPPKLTKREALLWEERIETASWLGVHDSEKAIAWVFMTVRLEKAKFDVQASTLAQWRALGSELGFDPAARARLGGVSDGGSDDPADKFFDD